MGEWDVRASSSVTISRHSRSVRLSSCSSPVLSACRPAQCGHAAFRGARDGSVWVAVATYVVGGDGAIVADSLAAAAASMTRRATVGAGIASSDGMLAAGAGAAAPAGGPAATLAPTAGANRAAGPGAARVGGAEVAREEARRAHTHTADVLVGLRGPATSGPSTEHTARACRAAVGAADSVGSCHAFGAMCCRAASSSFRRRAMEAVSARRPLDGLAVWSSGKSRSCGRSASSSGSPPCKLRCSLRFLLCRSSRYVVGRDRRSASTIVSASRGLA